MDDQLNLTPEANSNNFENIINIILEFPPTKDRDISLFEEVLVKKTALELHVLNQCLEFFFLRDSLTLSLLEFLLKTANANEFFKFIPWFNRMTLHKNELLEISYQLTEINDLKKISDRLNQLEKDQITSEIKDYDFFYALIILIENEIDKPSYIQALEKFERPHLLVKSYVYLKKEDLLREPYDQFLSQSTMTDVSPWVKALLLVRLNKHKLLTYKNFILCNSHSDLLALEKITALLAEKPNLLENYFDIIFYKNASLLQMYLYYLKNNNLLTEVYIEILYRLNGGKLDNFIRILFISDRYAVIKPDLIIGLSELNTRRLKKIGNALNLLIQNNYLNQETLDYVFSYYFYPDLVIQFAQSLIILKDNKLPNEWIDIIHSSSQPLPITFCIIELYKSGILSTEIFSKINQVRSINFFYKVLKNLAHLKILTEENLFNLIRLDNFIDDNKYKAIITKKHISPLFYEHIFNILTLEGLSREDKFKKIDDIIADNSYEKKLSILINPAESTHLASVQTSFTQIVNKFMLTYWQKIDNFDEVYKQITADLDLHLAENPFKYLAAKRALTNLISDPTFVDSESKLNLKQLLILFWVGIHDSTHREGNLADAKKQLFEALYEAQRGGNINTHGQDNGLADEPICCKGVVHKLLEKLVGIHSYLEFVYITPELASLKFPIVVEEEARDYLQSLNSEIIFFNYERFTEEGVPSIWKYIESNVRTRMLEEFGSLYVNIDAAGANSVHKDFEELMASHNYLSLDSNLLTSIKVSYVEKNFESALHVDSNCAGSVATATRLQEI